MPLGTLATRRSLNDRAFFVHLYFVASDKNRPYSLAAALTPPTIPGTNDRLDVREAGIDRLELSP